MTTTSSDIPYSPDSIDRRSRNAPIPASLLLLGIIYLPLLVLANVGGTGYNNPRLAAGFLAVLLLVLCAYPHVSRVRHTRPVGILFRLLTIAYAADFGLSSLFLVLNSRAATFPNLTLPQDYLFLVRGLSWAILGIYAMESIYFARLRTRNGGDHFGRPHMLQRLFLRTPPVPFFITLCLLGIVGELHSIQTGAALYIYNSPSFAAHTGLVPSNSAGLFSVLGQLYLVGMVGLFAYALSHRRRLLLAVSALLWIAELLYYAYGTYKYGLISLGIFGILVFAIQGRQRMFRNAVPAVILLVLVIFPVVNLARANLLEANLSGQPNTSHFLGVFSGSATAALTGEHRSFAVHYLLPIAQRLNGPDALAVASKYEPVYGLQGVGTYSNIISFMLPSIVRPFTHETYLPWETKYVGEPLGGYNVIPVPAVVEAYLNFGVPGVAIVMALLGLCAAEVDTFGSIHRRSALAVALFAFVSVELLDIETSLFVIVIPIVKISAIVLVLAWLASVVYNPSGRHRHLL